MRAKEFINEGLRDPKDNPCWKGYHPVGTKKKRGKTVPNCVPVNEGKEKYTLELVRHPDYDTLRISSNHQNGWVEVRGKTNYEIDYDPQDPLHQFLDTLDAPTVSTLMANGGFTLNGGNPRSKPAIDAARQMLAVNEGVDPISGSTLFPPKTIVKRKDPRRVEPVARGVQVDIRRKQPEDQEELVYKRPKQNKPDDKTNDEKMDENAQEPDLAKAMTHHFDRNQLNQIVSILNHFKVRLDTDPVLHKIIDDNASKLIKWYDKISKTYGFDSVLSEIAYLTARGYRAQWAIDYLNAHKRDAIMALLKEMKDEFGDGDGLDFVRRVMPRLKRLKLNWPELKVIENSLRADRISENYQKAEDISEDLATKIKDLYHHLRYTTGGDEEHKYKKSKYQGKGKPETDRDPYKGMSDFERGHTIRARSSDADQAREFIARKDNPRIDWPSEVDENFADGKSKSVRESALTGGIDEDYRDAARYAATAHIGQKRSGGKPYISHPVRVANIVKKYKDSKQLNDILSAAFLHDTIEDTDTDEEQLHKMFGALVASLVKELTSDKSEIEKLGKTEYLADKMTNMSSWALVIKLADRLDNVSDIKVAKNPEWRHRYRTETETILDRIERDRVLSGTHKQLIELIRAKLAELDESAQNASLEKVPVSMPVKKHIGENVIKLGTRSEKARAWIEKVYAKFPQTWQKNHVMSMGGTGDDQQFAMFELEPSFSQRDAVEIKWFQAYPMRQGVGSRAMKELQRMAHEDGIALTLYPWDKGQVSQSKLTKFYKGAGFKPTAKGAKNMAWSPVSENFADGKGPRDIAAEFMADPIGKKYAKADCKTSTRAFVKWAEAKGLKPETMNLAPPSQGMLDKRPELLQDGQGAGHIFPVVNGYGIDFTATQFPGITEIPLITPVSQIPSLYKRIGGYFTDAPEWMDNRTSWLGPWDKIPADVMKDRDFADEYFKENFADGKGPGKPGDSARHGIPKGATIAQLEKAAKAPGRKGQLARWQLNMRRGKAKK